MRCCCCCCWIFCFFPIRFAALLYRLFIGRLFYLLTLFSFFTSFLLKNQLNNQNRRGLKLMKTHNRKIDKNWNKTREGEKENPIEQEKMCIRAHIFSERSVCMLCFFFCFVFFFCLNKSLLLFETKICARTQDVSMIIQSTFCICQHIYATMYAYRRNFSFVYKSTSWISFASNYMWNSVQKIA